MQLKAIKVQDIILQVSNFFQYELQQYEHWSNEMQWLFQHYMNVWLTEQEANLTSFMKAIKDNEGCEVYEFPKHDLVVISKGYEPIKSLRFDVADSYDLSVAKIVTEDAQIIIAELIMFNIKNKFKDEFPANVEHLAILKILLNIL